MLTEHFIASVGVPLKPSPTHVAKDAAIFIHEYQPLVAQRHVFKKSATPPNCLAVSSSHIFAAQAEKAVVHVYSREKGNQEAIVPFIERITCIALACDEAILVLGTAEGRVSLWETASCRQVSTAQAHLQAVTVLAVDPTENFLLTASKDSTVHVWSIPALLSFADAGVEPLSPIRTFSSHRAEIGSLVVGHSSSFSNIAISVSVDKTCFVWDYHTNNVLRTYLLPSTPKCLALDAGDRAVYVGYDDGAVQQLDLYSSTAGSFGSIHNTKDARVPVQPPLPVSSLPSDRSVGAALSLSISFDGSTLLTGHETGTILAWDAAKSGHATSVLQNSLPGPVTNLSFLPVTGFVNEKQLTFKIPAVVKPKFGAFDSSSGAVPGNYAINVELLSNLPRARASEFDTTLSAPLFPSSMLDEGLNELLTWRKGSQQHHTAAQEESVDFMALEDEPSEPRVLTLEEQNAGLKAELEALRKVQSASFEKLEKINAERKALLEREQVRLMRTRVSGSTVRTNGKGVDDGDMDYSSSSED